MRDVWHVQQLEHRHAHDGRGDKADALEAPALRVLLDVRVQLGGVFRDAAHQTADILLLFFVGRLLVNLVLGGTAREALVRQLLIQKLLNRQFGEAQLIGQMRGDLSCGAACHIPASFSLSRFVINQT